MLYFNIFLPKGWFSFRDWGYGTNLLKEASAIIVSITYISLVIAFIHLDVISTCIHDKIGNFPSISNKIVDKHSHILSLIANWGVLLMLFVDIVIAHKSIRKIWTLLNFIGVASIIFVFWCAVGYTTETGDLKEGLACPNGCLIALIIFIFISFILKYITIKPQDKK